MEAKNQELERLLGHKLTSVEKLRSILREYGPESTVCVHIKSKQFGGLRSMNLFAVDVDESLDVVTLVFAEETADDRS